MNRRSFLLGSASMLVASQLPGGVTGIVKVLPASDGVALKTALHPGALLDVDEMISLNEQSLIDVILECSGDGLRIRPRLLVANERLGLSYGFDAAPQWPELFGSTRGVAPETA